MWTALLRVGLLGLAACVAYGGVIDFASLKPLGGYSPVEAGDTDQPDLAVSYQTLNEDFSVFLPNAAFWNEGYSDLPAAVLAAANLKILEITLTPVGYADVTLDSFYLGSYFLGPARTAEVLRVTDGEGTVLWSSEPYNYAASAAAALIHVGVTAPVLKLQLGTDWNLGVNLLSYHTGQLPDDGDGDGDGDGGGDPGAVPEPSTYALMGAGLAFLAWRRRR